MLKKAGVLVFSVLLILAVSLFCLDWIGYDWDVRGTFTTGSNLLGDFFNDIKGICD